MTTEQVPSNQWNTPWRASGFAVYDTSGNLVAHTGITGNRSMHGKQLEMMAAMIAEAVNAYSAGEPPAEHPDPYKRCQHDLLKPGTTIEVIDAWKAKCVVCIEFFDLPGRPSQPPGDDAARLNWWFMNVLHVGGDDDDDESGSDIEYEARLCRTPDEFRAMIDAAMGRTPTKEGEQP